MEKMEETSQRAPEDVNRWPVQNRAHNRFIARRIRKTILKKNTI